MSDRPGETADFILQRQDAAERSSRAGKSKSRQSERPPSSIVDDKGLPERVRRKYYAIEKDGRKAHTHFYADAAGEYLAFKVTENRLITRLEATEVVRDMVIVAQHRGWEAMQARGSQEFRREAWLEARLRGIAVQGYEPTELDRLTLSDRRDALDRSNRRVNDRPPERLDYDRGVSGRLVEVGRGPYRDRPDAETSTYAVIELDDGRKHKMWSVGLEKAFADSQAKPDDRLQVVRDAVERVTKDIKVIDATTGRMDTDRRELDRNRWRVTAEKFRTADRKAAAADAALAAAESQIIVIEKALERVLAGNAGARHRILEATRERIAKHLEHGHSFARATIKHPVHRSHDLGTEKDKHDLRQEGSKLRVREKQR
ncbi:LPD7 domain-containing protein [Bradyrhizobium sp. Cp5.3]|uniref:LPD7 domain-containing protein n=1 Tax=Bradyrhizobium sp. Cp5.3 TaxID=443598 RepID=UPI00040164DB|nr:LPD7 domain-containing protein [Bradyrhizobium sp. Cp5.3]